MSEPTVVTSLDHLGALVAEHVMGWSVCKDARCEGCDSRIWQAPSGRWIVIDCNASRSYRHFAEIVDDAWLVVDKLVADGWLLQLDTLATGEWYARFMSTERAGHGTAPTATTAICLAALAAAGQRVIFNLEDNP